MHRVVVSLALVAGCRGTSAPSPAGSASGAAPVAALDEAAARAALVAIGTRAQTDLDKAPTATDDDDGLIFAVGPCTRPTADEQTALRARLDPWTASKVGERAANAELKLAFGCMERTGIVIDAERDDGSERLRQAMWWTLRVTPTSIDVLQELSSRAPEDVTEFDTGTQIRTLALIDLDGDGALDAIEEADTRGGSDLYGELEVSVLGARPRVLGKLHGNLTVAASQPPPDAHTLVLALSEGNDESRTQWRCVTKTGPWAACPPTMEVARRGPRRRAAELLATSPETAMTDRALLAEALTLLAVPDAEQAPLLAYAVAHGSAFGSAIARVGRARAVAIVERTEAEEAGAEAVAQGALAAKLREALHEPACAAPTDAQRKAADAAVTRWAKAREPGAEELEVTVGCAGKSAAYWVAHWSRNSMKPGAVLHAGLFYVKGATAVLAVDSSMPEPPMRGAGGDSSWPGPDIVAKFSDTGGSLTALATVAMPPTLDEDEGEPPVAAPPRALTAVVDGRVTGTHPLGDDDALAWRSDDGALGFTMVSDPLARTATDQAATYWHAAPGGVVAVATIALAAPRAPMTATDPVAQLLERSERLVDAAALINEPIDGPLTPEVRADRLAAAALLGAPKAILDEASAAAN